MISIDRLQPPKTRKVNFQLQDNFFFFFFEQALLLHQNDRNKDHKDDWITL